MTLSGGKMPNARRPRTRDAGPTNEDGLTLVHAILQAGRELRQRLAMVGHPRHLSDTELLLLGACSRPPVAARPEAAFGDAVRGELGPVEPASGQTGYSEAGLAGPLGLSGGELSGILYDLRDRGLLQFSRVPDGDNCQQIELTAEGRAVLAEAMEAFNTFVAGWLRGVAPGTFATWPPAQNRTTRRTFAKPRATAVAGSGNAGSGAANADGVPVSRLAARRPRGKRGAA